MSHTDSLDDKLKKLLLDAYYRGKDKKGYSDYELGTDISTAKALIQEECHKTQVKRLESLKSLCIARKVISPRMLNIYQESFVTEETIDKQLAQLKEEEW